MSGFPIDFYGSLSSLSAPVLQQLLTQQLNQSGGNTSLPDLPSNLLPISPAVPSSDATSGANQLLNYPKSTISAKSALSEIPVDVYEPGMVLLENGTVGIPSRFSLPAKLPILGTAPSTEPLISSSTATGSEYASSSSRPPTSAIQSAALLARYTAVGQWEQTHLPVASAGQTQSPFTSDRTGLVETAEGDLLSDTPAPNETVSLSMTQQISNSGKTLPLLQNPLTGESFLAQNIPINGADFTAPLKSVLLPLLTLKAIALTETLRGDSMAVLSFDAGHTQQILSRLLTAVVDLSARGSRIDFITDRQPLDDTAVQLRFAIQARDCNLPGAVSAYLAGSEKTALLPGPPLTNLALNLGLCRQLAELMGGTLAIHGDFKEGTIFYLELPARRESAAASRPEIGRFSGRRILLAEDDPSLAEGDAVLLRNREITVDVAYGSEASMRLFRRSRAGSYAAVLTSLESEFAQKIRLLGRPDSAWIPIVALLTTPPTGNSASLMEQGLDSYLLRPYAPQELYEVLRLLIF